MKIYIQTVTDAMERHPELAAIMLWEQAAGGLNFPEIVAHSLARIPAVISGILQEGTDKVVIFNRVISGAPWALGTMTDFFWISNIIFEKYC